MKRRILKGCGRDLAQNFIRASGERGFGRLRNFVSVGGARNFTLALAAICILGGCDGGSDGQSSTQNSAPQGLESKQNSDLNSTIDEFANDAKVLGEALQNLQKKVPEALNDFAARNADRIEDILKQGEAAAREAGKNLDKMGESLQGIIKDANESIGKVLEGFGVQPRQEPRGGRSQGSGKSPKERDDRSDYSDDAGRQSFRI